MNLIPRLNGRKRDALRTLRSAVRLGFINHRSLTNNAAISACLGAEPEFQALAEIEPRWKSVVEWHRRLENRPVDRTRTRPTAATTKPRRT